MLQIKSLNWSMSWGSVASLTPFLLLYENVKIFSFVCFSLNFIPGGGGGALDFHVDGGGGGGTAGGRKPVTI